MARINWMWATMWVVSSFLFWSNGSFSNSRFIRCTSISLSVISSESGLSPNAKKLAYDNLCVFVVPWVQFFPVQYLSTQKHTESPSFVGLLYRKYRFDIVSFPMKPCDPFSLRFHSKVNRKWFTSKWRNLQI